jgi:hypothetical protein
MKLKTKLLLCFFALTFCLMSSGVFGILGIKKIVNENENIFKKFIPINHCAGPQKLDHK